MRVADKIIECDTAVSEVKASSVALRLMFHILNWNFRNSTNVGEGTKNRINLFPCGGRRETMEIKKSECVLVQVVLCKSSHILCSDFTM